MINKEELHKINKEGQKSQDNLNGQEDSVGRTKLERIMKKKKILQKEIALKADIELYQISELCSGKRTNIMLDTAKRICRVLKCKLDDAFGD